MAVLKAAARNSLPGSAFALPGRRFPIHDLAHGRAALSMLHNASPAEQATIKRKVYSRYPQLRSGGAEVQGIVKRLKAM